MSKSFEITAIGQVLLRGAQKFECVAIEPTTRKDGTATSFAVLKGQCAECGADFTFTSARRGAVFQPNRRCDKHKAAGVPLGVNKSVLVGELRKEIATLRQDKADLAKRLDEAERAGRAAVKQLARYELTDAEARAFAALCAARAKEQRAHLGKARTRYEASVFG